MKKILLVTLILLASFISFSQDSLRRPKTKIEEMALREGVVIKKEFDKLGEINGLSISLLTVTEINSDKGVQMKGVKFSNYSSIGSSYYERSSYIDPEEINGVIKFIDFARQLVTAPTIYTEYVYTTKGDFKAAIFTASNFAGKLNGDWTLILYADKFYGNSSVSIPKKKIDELYDTLVKARDLLNKPN